jgi:hypothetical protein
MSIGVRILAGLAALSCAGGAWAECAPPSANASAVAPAPCLGLGSGLKPSGSGIEINKNWSLDAGASGSRFHSATSATPATSSALGGYTGLDRNYTAAQLNGAYWVGRSQFATRLSVLQGDEKLNAYGLGAGFVPEFRNRLSQAAATARYGYWFEGFMPYASLTLSSGRGVDRAANPAYGLGNRDGVVPKIGVDFYSRQGLTGGIAYSLEQGAGSGAPKNEVWSANLGFRF